MNTEKAQAEITLIIEEARKRQPWRKQYPVTKTQTNALTELGIVDLMPARFGYMDAAMVIDAANDNGGQTGGFNADGEGDVASTNASALYKALHEETPGPKAGNEEEARYEKKLNASYDAPVLVLIVKAGEVINEFVYSPHGAYRSSGAPWGYLGKSVEYVKKQGFKKAPPVKWY